MQKLFEIIILNAENLSPRTSIKHNFCMKVNGSVIHLARASGCLRFTRRIVTKKGAAPH